MALDRLAEYEICKRRGHESSGHGLQRGMGPLESECRWCGTYFYFTKPELVEVDPPTTNPKEPEHGE